MLKPSPKILFQKLGSEAVILHLQSEEYFGLDEVGTRIWEVFNEYGSIDKTVNVLVAEYDVEANQLKVDAEELIQKLKTEQILIDG